MADVKIMHAAPVGVHAMMARSRDKIAVVNFLVFVMEVIINSVEII